MSGAKRSRSNGTPRTGTRGFGKKNLHGPWKSKLSAKQKTLVQEKLVGQQNTCYHATIMASRSKAYHALPFLPISFFIMISVPTSKPFVTSGLLLF